MMAWMYAPDHAALATPIGLVLIEGDEHRLTRIRVASQGAEHPGIGCAVREARGQIAAWFAGDLTRFDLPLTPPATARSAVLRQAIVDVGHGETASYGELARRHGSSPRAVGQACARNPFPLIVPCHRVLAAGGALGPYSAGDGPVTKRWLLDFETSRTAA